MYFSCLNFYITVYLHLFSHRSKSDRQVQVQDIKAPVGYTESTGTIVEQSGKDTDQKLIDKASVDKIKSKAEKLLVYILGVTLLPVKAWAHYHTVIVI